MIWSVRAFWGFFIVKNFPDGVEDTESISNMGEDDRRQNKELYEKFDSEDENSKHVDFADSSAAKADDAEIKVIFLEFLKWLNNFG